MENDFQGLDGQTMPVMPDEFVKVVTDRYVELYEMITGNDFDLADTSDITARIQGNVDVFLESYEA